MTRQIIINAAPWETRVAVLDEATLSELYVERGRNHGIAGNIYKGKVVRVLPGMQAAFVDVGLDKAAFLHVSDLLPPAGAEPVPPDDDEPPEAVAAVDAEPIAPDVAEPSADEPAASDADGSARSGAIASVSTAGTASGASSSSGGTGSAPAGGRRSETWRNAALSRPTSTNAACIPGRTRTTLPL